MTPNKSPQADGFATGGLSRWAACSVLNHRKAAIAHGVERLRYTQSTHKEDL